ncbi:helical backbone metal receptor [Proteinivorax hydrogeniformans]|uniref:Helical backbone metal receptor n=1 Tax=Proteinivorax hydrogeniformans TaxID=1826727 RepID=A0AAU8HSJ1_9FIRM
MRIISLIPSITESFYYLNLQHNLVGVTEHCNYPPEAACKDKVGTFGAPDIIKIFGLAPDVIYLDGTVHKKEIELLKKRQIKVIDASVSKVYDIFKIMRNIAKVCNINSAEQTVDELKKRLAEVQRKPNARKIRVLRVMYKEPLIVPGPLTYQYEALKIIGARQMELPLKDGYTEVKLKEIQKFDPEVILYCGVEKEKQPPQRCKSCSLELPLCHRTACDVISKDWLGITAVKNNRAYPISCSTLCRPGPRLINNLVSISKLIHS